LLLAVAACQFEAGTATHDAPAPVDVAVAIDAPAADATLVDASGPWLAGFAFRKPIVVTTGGATTLTDFPVGVLEGNDAALAAHARGDGADLVVTGDDGVTVLSFERVTFGSGGAVELWVRVPTLPPTPTTLYLYYGGPVTPATPTATWSSLFAGVWHLSDTGSGASDSTTAAHALVVPGSSTTPAHIGGIAGGARQTNGTTDALSITDPADGGLDFGSASFSFSAWVFEESALQQFDTPFYKGGTSQGQPGYCMLLGTGNWEAKIHDGAEFYDGNFGSDSAFTGRWVQLAAVVDRGSAVYTTYADGSAAGAVALNPIQSLSSSQPFALGTSFSEPFRGRLDEVRIYRGALTADWVAAEHANLTKQGFVAVGSEQTP
jgi:hypothetical protein